MKLNMGTLSIVAIAIATMHRRAAMLSLLVSTCCFLLLATHAQQHHHQQTTSTGNSNTTSPSCNRRERDALLAFKHGVTSDPAGLLDSWRRDGGHGDQDCCRWRGVRCSNLTGHVHKLQLRGNNSYGEGADFLVGQISPSLLALEHLEHLDVSQNDLEGPNSRIPEFLGSLKNLKYLNLSGIPFYGSVPPQLGNLSRLQSLDLSYMAGTNSTDLSWLTCLPSIQYLNLDNVDLSTVVDWPHVMNMLPSLSVLHLSGCSLVSANQSLQLLNLTNLEELDASRNSFNHPLATSWFWNITSLKHLYLNCNYMYGQFLDNLGDMTSLQVLDLSYNLCFFCYDDDDEKYRIMTKDMKKLCNLEVLNLYSSLLHGDITDLFRNLPSCSPNKLQELNLGANQLTGMLPRWIGQLTSLVTLNLGSNNIAGPVPASVGQFASLQTLDLSFNNLSGNVPYEIGKLTNLTHLDLSFNNLSGNVPYEIDKLTNLTHLDLNSNELDGVITEEHFVSATSLQYIDLSYNSLKIEISSNWQPPFRLDTTNFAACQMGPLFPAWLQWHVTITNLDISSAGIADRLPQWFSDVFTNVIFMNISNNQLNGTLPTNLDFISLQYLFLSSNQLTGKIPTLPPNITILDLSNNFLSGPLPSSTRSANLRQLSLFSNQITGHIPQSFCKFQGLVLLDLSNNFLEGELPSCLGVMKSMEFIALSNNSFSGDFPSCVQNFANIKFIDLSRNKFSGRLPMWIGNLMVLIILQLSHNKFFGNIPANITNLASLRYMDLNNNEFSGPLPSYLSNMQAMTQPERFADSPFYTFAHVTTVWKGQEYYGSLVRVLINYMISIDLSSNNLTGEISEEITNLVALVNLNLSWNHLSGGVPNYIGDMQSLESLDLSRNELSGKIPSSLSKLTFLSDLDLSYNNLTGRIPSGTQLDTLYAEYPSMYIGNTGLCGNPLPNSCSSEGHAPKPGHGIEFFYLGLGCGFVVGAWMAFGVLLLKRSWRIAYFRLSDKLCDKVYVLVAIWARKIGTDHHA